MSAEIAAGGAGTGPVARGRRRLPAAPAPCTLRFDVRVTCPPRIGRLVGRLLALTGPDYAFDVGSHPARTPSLDSGPAHVEITVSVEDEPRPPDVGVRSPRPAPAWPDADAPPVNVEVIGDRDELQADPLMQFEEEHPLAPLASERAADASPPVDTLAPVFFLPAPELALSDGFELAPEAPRHGAGPRPWPMESLWAATLRPTLIRWFDRTRTTFGSWGADARSLWVRLAERARHAGVSEFVSARHRALRSLLARTPLRSLGLPGAGIFAVLLILVAACCAFLFLGGAPPDARRPVAPNRARGSMPATRPAVTIAAAPDTARDARLQGPERPRASTGASYAVAELALSATNAGGRLPHSLPLTQIEEPGEEPPRPPATSEASPRAEARSHRRSGDDHQPRSDRRVVASDVVSADERLRGSSFVGSLEIRSTPAGALVSLDGIPHGQAPLTLARLRAGAHTVRVELAGYERWTRAVSIVSGRRVRLTPALRRVGDRLHEAANSPD